MTLPVQPSSCCAAADKRPAALRCPRRAPRPPCLSAAWAEPPSARRERRRAICSWSVGYGTLNEFDELAAPIAAAADNDDQTLKRAKVADNAVLLESRGRRLVNSIAVPNEPPARTHRRRNSRIDLLGGMPGIKAIFGGGRRRNSSSLDSGSPLVAAPASPPPPAPAAAVKPTRSLASLRRCDPLAALSGALRTSSSSSSLEPLQAHNRLRASPSPSQSSRMCSRCSSLLTLASTSRYSLNSAGFVPVPTETAPVLCKLCLAEVPCNDVVHIQHCNCSFCAECMKAYVEFEIVEGAYDISCPDAQCPAQGILTQDEIKRLAGAELLEKHIKYRLNREVELDKTRTWCPRAGCETVCFLCPAQKCLPQSVYCPTCTTDFCSNCKLEWHEGISCDDYGKQLAREGKDEPPGIPFDSDLIKCCPMCNVPIEKDEGCAQMMCKRCKHVFCWYCLASLDDDFLLRHYDKGPCKNKLGHSRASVIWHRTQVIGIFAGFGILLLVASPLLLLAAPCIVCCKCRVCNVNNTKLDNEEDTPAED